jgi:hypothetical protein
LAFLRKKQISFLTILHHFSHNRLSQLQNHARATSGGRKYAKALEPETNLRQRVRVICKCGRALGRILAVEFWDGYKNFHLIIYPGFPGPVKKQNNF